MKLTHIHVLIKKEQKVLFCFLFFFLKQGSFFLFLLIYYIFRYLYDKIIHETFLTMIKNTGKFFVFFFVFFLTLAGKVLSICLFKSKQQL